MRRRILLASAALPLLPRIALAQGDPRQAGRMAMAAANAGRWAEAESLARNADPAIAKTVTWLRLQQRGQGSASEIVGFVLANPDWPGQDNLGRRAEETLAGDADDALATSYVAAKPPRTMDGYQRLADALQRGAVAQGVQHRLGIGQARYAGGVHKTCDLHSAKAAGQGTIDQRHLVRRGQRRLLVLEPVAWRHLHDFDRLVHV